ncbi:hypothetical protein [Holzapfeliella sp. JNUCC 80]
MQNEQVTTRYFKDGKIQMIDKPIWDEWTFGNPEQKVANGLTTVEVPQNLLDKAIKFNTQTMTWEDASEDEINRVKTQIKQVSDELKKAQEERENTKTDSEEKQKTIEELQTRLTGLDDTIADLTFQIMQNQGGTQ